MLRPKDRNTSHSTLKRRCQTISKANREPMNITLLLQKAALCRRTRLLEKIPATGICQRRVSRVDILFPDPTPP